MRAERTGRKRSTNTSARTTSESKASLTIYVRFRGKYAKVFKCINENDKKEYAMKILKKDKMNNNFKMQGKKVYNFLESEIAILKKLVCL